MNNNANATATANSHAQIPKNTVNKSISICLKDCRLFENKGTKIKDIDQIAYKNEKNYQNSFKKSPISDFEKSIPEKDKKEISICIYNANNSDGLFSAWCFYKFIEEHGLCSSDIEFVPMSPASVKRVDYRIQKLEGKLRGKCVIIIDIATPYVHTVNSLSFVFYPQTTINSMLTSYQPKTSTNSTLALATFDLGNSTGTSI